MPMDTLSVILSLEQVRSLLASQERYNRLEADYQQLLRTTEGLQRMYSELLEYVRDLRKELTF